MFSLSAVEVAFMLLWVVGVGVAVLGALSKVFTVREAIVAIALALFVPVVGSVAAIVLYAKRRAEGAVREAAC